MATELEIIFLHPFDGEDGGATLPPEGCNWVWSNGNNHEWSDSNNAVFSCNYCAGQVVSQSHLFSALTYTVSDGQADVGHGTGLHWHSTSAPGPPFPALPTATRYAEVGGMFGGEEIRTALEFDIMAVSGTITQALLKFVVTDLTLVPEGALGINPIGGLYGQDALAADFNVIGYQANGVEEIPDFNAAVVSVIQTLDPTTMVAGQEITVDVTAFAQARHLLGDNHLGFRFQLAVSDTDAGAIVFENCRLELDTEVCNLDVFQVSDPDGLIYAWPSGEVIGFY